MLSRFWDRSLSYSKPTQEVTRHDAYTTGETTGGLSVLFTVMCIVDLFGVFPVVALPKSIISCGIYGAPLVVAVIGLQIYTAVLLGRSWLLAQEVAPTIREKNRFPYAAVAELAFGTYARKMVTFLIDATVFAAGVPNFIVASQSMQLFSWKITGGAVGVSYCHWMIIIGLLLCPVMWLGSPKDMKPLAITSVCIVSTVAAVTWACILTDDVSPPSINLSSDIPTLQNILVAYGILAFQFDIHPMLLTIQVDMKDSKRINTAVFGGFAVSGFLFGVTTVLAALRYGTDVESNILQGMPASIPLFVVALLVTLQLCLSSAVGNSALFQHVEDLLKIPRDFCVQRCILRSSIIALAVFLGESVPRFDLVMGFVGSTLTGPLMFILPPMFFLKLCYMKTNLTNNIDEPVGNDIKMLKKTGQHGIRIQNGVLNNNQNGGDKTKLLQLYKKIQTNYKTFQDNRECFDDNVYDQYEIKIYDIVLACIVVLIGITATVVATYSSWSDAITSAIFTPPCLINATAAARSFLEITTIV